MNNELKKFESQYLQAFKNLKAVVEVKKKAEAEEKEIRKQLTDAFIEHDIKQIDNDFVKISFVEGSESVTIDLKELQKHEPDLYDELLEDYPQTSVKKSHVRIVVK